MSGGLFSSTLNIKPPLGNLFGNTTGTLNAPMRLSLNMMNKNQLSMSGLFNASDPNQSSHLAPNLFNANASGA